MRLRNRQLVPQNGRLLLARRADDAMEKPMNTQALPRHPTQQPVDYFVPGPGNQRQLRDAFGAFATGVTVVTAQSGQGPLGMTANSFSSLSMDPPLILWSPARKSLRFAAFTETTHFAVHVLSDQQAEIAGHFARQGHDFSAFDTENTISGVPILSGCLAVFECQTEAIHDGGDHAIVVGRVQGVQRTIGLPLVFSAGQFGSFDPSLVETTNPR